MQRTRIALFSIVLLGVALASVPDATSANGSQRGAVSPFGITVPTERAPQPRAAEAALDPQQYPTAIFDLVTGAGTGGGDMPEVEPNDSLLTANVVHDLPFNCTGAIDYDGDQV